MKPRTPARLVAAMLLLGTLAAPSVALGLTQERITIRRGPPVVRDYGPLAPNDPLFAGSITPSFCMNAPGCDTIPMTVVVPTGLKSNEDFLVRLTLSWDAATRSNLQLYIWTNPPASDPNGPRLIAQSATEAEPEKVQLYRPDLKNYFIVVHHVAGSTASGPSGPNTGYTLRVEMTFQSYDSPYELLAPESTFGTPSTDYSAPGTAGPTYPPPRAAGRLGALPLAPLDRDNDFAGLSGRGDGLDAFRRPPQTLAVSPLANRAPAGPVNKGLLVLWAGVVPAGLAVGGALWLRRRAAASLDVD